MQIWHRISFGHRDGVDDAIASLAIKHKKNPLPGGGYVIHLKISESDPRWPEIASLVEEKKPVDMLFTTFSAEEILQVQWVRLVVTFERGYPQPEEGWEQLTYQNECPQCGAGYHQKAAFRLKGEPRMGRHDFLSLYWTHSVFCVPQVVETFLAHQIRGYDEWRPVIHKTDQPSEVVTQLVFPAVAQPGLAELDKLQPETCPQCGITKYAYHKRGYMHFKRESLELDTGFLLTHEWFGSGGYGGFREILVSNQVATLILEQGWRGVTLEPVKLL